MAIKNSNSVNFSKIIMEGIIMKVFISIISLVLVIALTNCSSVKVKYDFDPQYDFNSYKIYKWGKMQVKEDGKTSVRYSTK